MPKMYVFGVLCLYFFLNGVSCQGLGSGSNGNLRVCIVDGKGVHRRAGRYCHILDQERAGVECVIGNDRLDCLRRMGKSNGESTVDFGVFFPEDLIAAQWANLDVLVTNQLRRRHKDFERQMVAIINKQILNEGETSLEAMLKNRTLCHPGIGGEDERGISDTLSQYLELQLTQRSCDDKLSLAENRIRAMATFFGRSCKAGLWVPDEQRDAELKSKYPSLCSACAGRCDTRDGFWGMTGALNCMTYGSGDVTWVTLREATAYFQKIVNANNTFAFLCRNGSTQPLDTSEPCAWLQRPWPAIVTKRKVAESVSQIVSELTNASVIVDTNHWQGALAALLGSNQAMTEPLRPQQAPLDYLSKAFGFREAYSQTGCVKPRQVTICTTSIIERHKCDWLAEAGAVYGVDPPLQCEHRESMEKCFEAIENGELDVTVASPDWIVKAKRDFLVSPILYEVTPIAEKLNTIMAYVRNDSKITAISDLRGKRVAFPVFDGVAWHTVIETLINNKQIGDCKIANLALYFGDSCAPGIENAANISQEIREKFTKTCSKNGGHFVDGELVALRSLVEGRSEVSFISKQTAKQYLDKTIPETWAKEQKDIMPICPEQNKKYCLLSWSSLGQIYASNNVTIVKKHEIINMFKKLDGLFGRNHLFQTAMFSMYGTFNAELNVLFHNNTNTLATIDQLGTHPYNHIPLNFESTLSTYNFTSCHISSGNMASPLVLLILISLVLYVKLI